MEEDLKLYINGKRIPATTIKGARVLSLVRVFEDSRAVVVVKDETGCPLLQVESCSRGIGFRYRRLFHGGSCGPWTKVSLKDHKAACDLYNM
jgi:hypothetical protein